MKEKRKELYIADMAFLLVSAWMMATKNYPTLATDTQLGNFLFQKYDTSFPKKSENKVD